jgi:hypothetical protein
MIIITTIMVVIIDYNNGVVIIDNNNGVVVIDCNTGVVMNERYQED